AWRLQHQEDGWVRVIEADAAQRVEAAQVVFVGRIVAMPGNHVERRMIHVGLPQKPAELRNELEAADQVFVGCPRRHEITWVGQAVRAYRPQIRQLEQSAEILADVASRFAVGQYRAKPDTARNNGNFQGLNVYAPHFSVQLQAPPLGND